MDTIQQLETQDYSSHFSLHNIPFSVFSTKQSPEDIRCCTRLGNFVIDLRYLEQKGVFGNGGPLFKQLKEQNKQIFNQRYLNEFMSLGRSYWKEARQTIQQYLANEAYQEDHELSHDINNIILHIQAQIGDYTDFYSSKQHAYNVGVMFRGPSNALQPNWLQLPVGYHGRSSSVVVSGASIVRPSGQVKPPTQENPTFKQSQKLDFEVEMGVFLGGPNKQLNKLGTPIKVNEAEDSVFGFVILNDLSARDLQVWEYVPLGPFNAKNFGTVISPWIVTLEAIEQFRVQLPAQDPEPLKYLKSDSHTSFDINILTQLKSEKSGTADLISQTNYKYMYWSIAQQIAHHSVSGCNLQAGDLLGSGTISGPEKISFGSLLELNWNGSELINLSNGEVRTFLNDNDSVIMSAYSEKDDIKIGFGECVCKILPGLSEENYY